MKTFITNHNRYDFLIAATVSGLLIVSALMVKDAIEYNKQQKEIDAEWKSMIEATWGTIIA